MEQPNPVDPYMRLNPVSNLFEPVQWRREIMPYCLYPDAQFTNGPMVVNAFGGAPTPPFIYKLAHASIGLDNSLGNPLLINQIVFEDSTDTTALANFTIMLKDMGDKTQFMNQPIHIRNFAGTAQLAAGLSEPLFLPTRHNLLATFAKISGGAVNMRMFFWGQIHYTWSPSLLQYPVDRSILIALVNKWLERRKYVYPFYLTTEVPVILSANKSFEVDALIGDDGHFEATHILAASTGDFRVEIYNPQTKQTYMNGSIQQTGAIGTATNPQLLPAPTIVPAGQRLRLKFTDVSGSANRVDWCYRGRKIRAPWKNFEEVKKDLEVAAPKPELVGV